MIGAPLSGGPAPRGAEAAMTRLARGGTANLLGSAVSALCQFAVVLTVARLYRADEAGRFFATTAAFLIVLAVVQLGADQGVLRFVAWHLARGDGHHTGRILRLGAVPMLVASVAGAAILALLAGPVADLVGSGSDPGGAAMVRVLALALPVAAAYELLLAATVGFGTMRPTVLVERLLRPVLQAAAVLSVGVLGLGSQALAWAWGAPYVLALGCAAYALRRTMRASIARSQPSAAADSTGSGRSLGSEFWAYTGPRAAARICQVVLQRFDVILVAALVGPGLAAVYTAATRFIALGQLANQALAQVISPQLAAMLARDERAGAEFVLRRATQWLVALAWPGYLALIVLAPWFMGIFGPAYEVGASSLVVLGVAMLVGSAAGPLDVALLMAGRSSVSLLNMVVALAVDVIGCLLLVPRIGILGAAVAWAAAIVVRNGLAVLQARRLLAMTATSRELSELSVAALLCCALVPVPLALSGAPTLLVVLAVGAGTGLYLGWLWRRRSRLGLDAGVRLPDRRAGPEPAAP